MKLGLSALLLSCGALAACSSDTDARPVQTLAPDDWNIVLALVPDGDAIYAPRLTRLDVHAADGTMRTVAGVTYAGCPERKDERWGPTFLDRGYPSFLVHRNRAFLSDSSCGLWSVDLTSGAVVSLIAGPSGDPHWGGKQNGIWHGHKPFTVAPLGDDLAVCLSMDRWRERFEKTTEDPDRVEIWRVGLDGTPKEKLVALEPREEACTQLLGDGDTLYAATTHAIYRFDSASRHLQTLTTDAGTSFGSGLFGLAQDATHLYFLRQSALERVKKDGSERTVLLRRPSDFERARFIIASDGAAVYWVENYSLLRMPVTGGTPEVLVSGDEWSAVAPTTIALISDHVWFTRVNRVTPHDVTDPDTGITLKDVRLHFSIERVAK